MVYYCNFTYNKWLYTQATLRFHEEVEKVDYRKSSQNA